MPRRSPFGVQGAEVSSAEQRLACSTRLRALADRAFKLLMEDKLAANESFRILQALIRDVLQEIENPSAADPTRPLIEQPECYRSDTTIRPMLPR